MKLAVAKSGINVLTATDPNDFIFNSDYNTFKITEEGSQEVVLAAGAGEEFYVYNLAYPTVFAFGFVKFADGRVAPPGTKAAGADFWFTRLVADEEDLVFYYANLTGGNYTVTFKYIRCELPI